ncbi:MAG: MFS transporter [Cellvibrionales bacterium]|nr:MFS transporter [Cellvibrionales bacterium]
MKHRTAAADRVPFIQKIAYGSGALVNNLLAAAIGGMTIVLNLGLGMSPALVGLLGALPRLMDALTDPLMGYISDRTRTRWGRRRPWIFIGAICSGLFFMLLWQLPTGQSTAFYFWFFLGGSLLFYLAYTAFATPWVALGYELTADYHERTRLMGVQNFIGQTAYLLSPWFLTFMGWHIFANLAEGAAALAIGIGLVTIVVGIIPAIFLRERFKAPPADSKTKSLRTEVAGFFIGFAATLKVRPFLYLCAATFLVFNGFILISSLQSYVIIYYLFAGNAKDGAEYLGWAGTVSTVMTFVAIPAAAWLGTKIGKRHAFFVAIGISILGYALKWFCYNPQMPLLVLIPALFTPFGLGGLFTLMPAMVADVCDLDELQTRQRREGMFGSIFWWTVKLGMAVALAGGGLLLEATGFDVALAGEQPPRALLLMRLFDVLVPILSSALAIWAVAAYPITEAKAHSIRDQLQKRQIPGRSG